MKLARPWRGRPPTAMEAAFIEAEKTRKTKMTDNLKFQGRAALTNTVVEFQVPQEMVADEQPWIVAAAEAEPNRIRFVLARERGRNRWHHGYQGRNMARLVIPHRALDGLSALPRFGNSPAEYEFSTDRERITVTVATADANKLRKVDRARGSTTPAAPVDLAALSAAVRAINEAVAADPDLSLSLVDGRVRLALIKELG